VPIRSAANNQQCAAGRDSVIAALDPAAAISNPGAHSGAALEQHMILVRDGGMDRQ